MSNPLADMTTPRIVCVDRLETHTERCRHLIELARLYDDASGPLVTVFALLERELQEIDTALEAAPTVAGA